MLDSLLGRARLKDAIADLEAELAQCREECDRLEQQLDAANRRRREAIREGQVAQEARSRLEDRVEQLEDELDRTRSSHEVTPRGRDRLSHTRMRQLLDLLERVDAGEEGAFTAMLADGDAAAVREALGDRHAIVASAAPCLCCVDQFGVIELAFDPPMPPEAFEHWDHHFRLEPEWFVPTGRFPFALVRADRFAYGTYDGETIAYVDGFESDVMGRHSKGGFSQARFERRREEQIDQHLGRCEARLADLDAERLVLAGSRDALDRLDVDARARVPVDASGPPREALTAAFEEVWTTTVYRL